MNFLKEKFEEMNENLRLKDQDLKLKVCHNMKISEIIDFGSRLLREGNINTNRIDLKLFYLTY